MPSIYSSKVKPNASCAPDTVANLFFNSPGLSVACCFLQQNSNCHFISWLYVVFLCLWLLLFHSRFLLIYVLKASLQRDLSSLLGIHNKNLAYTKWISLMNLRAPTYELLEGLPDLQNSVLAVSCKKAAALSQYLWLLPNVGHSEPSLFKVIALYCIAHPYCARFSRHKRAHMSVCMYKT